MQGKNLKIREEFVSLLDRFMEMLSAERNLSENTLHAYKNDTKDFLLFCEEQGLNIIGLKDNHIEAYVKSLKILGLLNKTIKRKISSLKQFFVFLITEKFIVTNPTVYLTPPKGDMRLPKPITPDILAKLTTTARNDKSPYGIRALTLIEVLYATGMRISELITMKLTSLQRERSHIIPEILIYGKGGKERIVFLNNSAIEALESYLKVRDIFMKRKEKYESPWLFPSLTKGGEIGHLTRQRCGQILKSLALQCGLNPTLVSPHKIRHSFATHILQNGANIRIVQELLGHSDISSSQIYTKVYQHKAAETLALHPLAKLHRKNNNPQNQ